MMKEYKPKTIKQAINDLYIFLDCDLWHSFEEEFETEKDFHDYLGAHFDILFKQVKEIQKQNRRKK